MKKFYVIQKPNYKALLFFAIILDTIQDVSKKDPFSEVFRYVKIYYHDDVQQHSELKVVEAFTSFIEVEDSSALHAQTDNEFHLAEGDCHKNCHEQGYNGAAEISGKYFGLHKKIQDVAPHAYYLHCTSHKLNLMLKDAMEAVTKTRQFCDTIESIPIAAAK